MAKVRNRSRCSQTYQVCAILQRLSSSFQTAHHASAWINYKVWLHQISGATLEEAECAFCDNQSTILANSCLMRFDHHQLVVLCTNFSSAGFGLVVCQPAMDAASKVAMAAYRAGKDFFFMTKESSAALQPVTFGSRKCRGNKTRLHSHLGEGFSSNWAINKNRHMLFAHNSYGERIVTPYNSSSCTKMLIQLFCVFGCG